MNWLVQLAERTTVAEGTFQASLKDQHELQDESSKVHWSALMVEKTTPETDPHEKDMFVMEVRVGEVAAVVVEVMGLMEVVEP